MTQYTWEDDEIPAIQQDGEYKALAPAIIEKWKRGKATKYVMPVGRNETALYMGLRPLMVKTGFESIHIRHKKDAEGKNVVVDIDGVKRDVYLLFPKPKAAQATPVAPAPAVPMPVLPAAAAV